MDIIKNYKAMKTASKIAIITYFVISSTAVLINYAGAFSAYPQPTP